MQPCNRIYHSTVNLRLNMFRAAYRSSSGALTVFETSGLHTHVVTGRSQVWVGINSITRLHLVGYFYWITLYVSVFPSNIRSSRLYTQHQVYVIQVSLLLASGHEMERKFHLLPSNKQSNNFYDIYMMLCVLSWTPDDGRKDHPKHVQRY